ncbi:flagellar hook-length control protein FliK [Pseudoxanthomonas wuyuanensis]|uniref:Flagellar hook-length control protein FliK n=1 Tax=Pseudoxanthomonas wuyuanensis TaxID=1073196 RepID=A0A286D028_9GAMM|nr:flagellar hook-length control protein FliK [Pseudoxanthomonas wuyuanensis]SOD51979.1 flagellar hook-length control protein FliK [Pseudoxanthomonas wuyuanensis]
MKSVSAVLASAAPPASAGRAGGNGGGNASGKPAFDELLDKHGRAPTATSAESAGANASAAKKQNEATAASTDKASPRQRKPALAEDWMIPAAGIWAIPAMLEPPSIAATSDSDAADMAAPLALATAPANAAPGTAAAPASPLPSGASAGTASAFATAGAPSVAATPLLAAGSDSAPAAQTTAADSSEPAQAATTAKPALQNPLSFVQHMAAGAAAIVMPEALGLAKDAADALRRDGDADPATPTINALASAAPVSSNGLARTATVNPLEAPTPDLHSEHFDEAIGSRLSWMADQKIGHAHIKVSPGEMGLIEVRLRMDGDRIHADFSSAQPEVRQALEASLPRLREMLDQQGFQLTQADVGHRQDPQASAPRGNGTDGNDGGLDNPSDEIQLPRPVITHARGLLDAYA